MDPVHAARASCEDALSSQAVRLAEVVEELEKYVTYLRYKADDLAKQGSGASEADLLKQALAIQDFHTQTIEGKLLNLYNTEIDQKIKKYRLALDLYDEFRGGEDAKEAAEIASGDIQNLLEVIRYRFLNLIFEHEFGEHSNWILELKIINGSSDSKTGLTTLKEAYQAYISKLPETQSVEDMTDDESSGVRYLLITGPRAHLNTEVGLNKVIFTEALVSHSGFAGKKDQPRTDRVQVLVYPSISASQASRTVLDEKNLETQFIRSGGPGGQNVNKVNTAVRLTYTLPDGTKFTVKAQTARTQALNYASAMDLLRGKVLNHYEQLETAQRADSRRALEDASKKVLNTFDLRAQGQALPAMVSGQPVGLSAERRAMDYLLNWLKERNLRSSSPL